LVSSRKQKTTVKSTQINRIESNVDITNFIIETVKRLNFYMHNILKTLILYDDNNNILHLIHIINHHNITIDTWQIKYIIWLGSEQQYASVGPTVLPATSLSTYLTIGITN